MNSFHFCGTCQRTHNALHSVQKNNSINCDLTLIYGVLLIYDMLFADFICFELYHDFFSDGMELWFKILKI